MELTENHKAWLNELYDNAIVEAHQTADNERGWAAGAPDQDTRELHSANEAEQLAYISVLEDLKDKIQFI